MTGLDRHGPEARALIARAERLQASSDRAFRRWIEGEVRSASGAASLATKSAEAWADVRLEVEYGDLIESGYTEDQIREIEEDES